MASHCAARQARHQVLLWEGDLRVIVGLQRDSIASVLQQRPTIMHWQE